MAKFKVGDRVKVDSSKYPQYYSATGTITLIWHDKFDNYSYNIDFQKSNLMANTIPEKWLELAEPENVFHVPSYAKEYWYNIDGNFSYLGLLQEWSFDVTQKAYKMVFINPKKPENFNCSNVSFDKENYKKYLFTQEEKIAYEKEKQDNPFKLEPHEFPHYRLELNDDALVDAIKYVYGKELDKMFFFGRGKDTKNRIPDRVVFNEAKGKVTVLISKFNDGVAPYRAYTSKVNVEGGDKYDEIFGFLLSYYKYLNRSLPKEQQQYLIGSLFSSYKTNKERLLILEGSIGQEIIKLFPNDLHKWVEIKKAIFVKKGGNKYWDHLEWKEMLRVHELETKREKQREVQKEIKKHQKAIEELKKKEV